MEPTSQVENYMVLVKDASLVTDTVTVVVTKGCPGINEKGDNLLYKRTFYYGITISWDPDHANKNKPYDKDVFGSIQDKYNVLDKNLTEKDVRHYKPA